MSFILFPIRIYCSDELYVSAIKIDSSIKFTIENNSKVNVFIANPEKCGAIITVKSDTFQGGVEKPALPSDPPWKHIVILTPKNVVGEITRLSSWSFTVPVDKNITISKLDISLWYSTEKEFKESTIRSLKLKDFPVVIK